MIFFLDYNNRFFIFFILTFILISFFSYKKYKYKKPFFNFLFSKKIYFSSSAIVDYCILIFNILVSPISLILKLISRITISIFFVNFLISFFGKPIFTIESITNIHSFLFYLGIFLIIDFTVYVVHLFHHYNRFFWHFHSLHHSAEVLTPFTVFRKHPIWNIINQIILELFIGIFMGIYLFIFYGALNINFLILINIIYFGFNLLGSNLRHSNIWFHWKKPFSFVFMSPSMHQIHHSIDKKHINKNFGEVLSFWDFIFNTIYIPNKKEDLVYGIGENIKNPHDTFLRALYVPFVDFFREFNRK
jgi:sterol desaturase/sphingolipid hydroxylase (fatty acid hydroxylase superfamily)